MKWFDIWCEDYESLIETAVRNIQSDLAAGYNPHGQSIMQSNETLKEFKVRYAQGLETFKTMDDKAVDRWCYYDLKKRGAI